MDDIVVIHINANDVSWEKIRTQAKNILREHFGILHTTKFSDMTPREAYVIRAFLSWLRTSRVMVLTGHYPRNGVFITQNLNTGKAKVFIIDFNSLGVSSQVVGLRLSGV
jgi:hypothetical protein